jgi:hypothetical protein
MENLTDLIYREFEKAGYITTDKLLWRHKTYTDYWVVYAIDGEYELEMVQNFIFDKFSGMINQEPEMEKNISLLILNRVEKEGKNSERVIADENDVYVFKKYVIQYTQEEWDAIKTAIEDDVPLSDLLMKEEYFASLKENTDSPLNLFYNVAHKLPFVTMNVTKKDYDITDELQVPERMRSMLMWIDNIPKWEKKNPTDDDIDDIKRAIERMITEEIVANDENIGNTPA